MRTETEIREQLAAHEALLAEIAEDAPTTLIRQRIADLMWVLEPPAAKPARDVRTGFVTIKATGRRGKIVDSLHSYVSLTRRVIVAYFVEFPDEPGQYRFSPDEVTLDEES